MSEEKKDKASGSKGLVGALVGLCLMIVGLTVAIVLVRNNTPEEEPEVELDASSKAVLFREEIDEKLRTDPDYNVPEALEDYAKVYRESSGSYRTYISVVYADYVCSKLEDCELAITILEDVEPGEDWPEFSTYYYELIGTYEKIGDAEKAQYYSDILNKKAEEGEEYYVGQK